MNKKERVREKKRRISSSAVMIMLVVGITAIAMGVGLAAFLAVYSRAARQNAVISSDHAVVQASNIMHNFTEDIGEGLRLVEGIFSRNSQSRDADMNALVSVRTDVVAVMSYDPATGELDEMWSGRQRVKESPLVNLSYGEEIAEKVKDGDRIFISNPHVESLLADYYPWVVSVCKLVKTAEGEERVLVMDTRFSQIAGYVDDVGIGHHGYCFIMDEAGNIIYHPQQQLIFSGLKEEKTKELAQKEDGSFTQGEMIYTILTLPDSGWRIVGISFVDEMVYDRMASVAALIITLLLAVLAITFVSSLVLSRVISRPMKGLAKAMEAFEKDASGFTYYPIKGTSEVEALSDSFGHMVVQIQELMTKVRNEEISLRKTELRALQAQINPHFLYNTLDSIAWMCEESRTKEAVEMVNALARLFRISISKGHELIPIEKEVEHARSYLMIQNFRYKNQFRYSFEVDEECLPYYCNKITLQPIIENAIYHGLNRMIDEGLIRIRIYMEEDAVIFTVEDNGVGMSAEQCRSILNREPGDNTGIGIKNVNDRIRIYFGEQYGLKIESEQDVGTKVIITMPKVKEEIHEA
ncbi:MAG: sensor histidine kinase [Eubacteriales bacterium]|nr:sensor histidine kinase [Eubacteriales bacterium]